MNRVAKYLRILKVEEPYECAFFLRKILKMQESKLIISIRGLPPRELPPRYLRKSVKGCELGKEGVLGPEKCFV